MNRIFLIAAVIAVNCSLFTINSEAQWQSDVRLTNDPAASYVYYNWCVASSGSSVYAVWEDGRNGNDEIYFKRSGNSGLSWGPDTRLTNSPGQSYDPSVTSTGSGVHVVWADNRDGRNEIYYKRTTDGGINWLPDTRLTNDTSARFNPSISISGTVVNIVWTDNRNGNYEIYYKRSSDGGSTWGADTRLTNSTGSSFGPSTAAGGLVLHAVWEDDRDGNYEIYYKRSTNAGLAWGPDIRLTNNPSVSTYSSISISGSALHVVWCDDRDGNWEVYYKRDTTGNPVGITNFSTEIPSEFLLCNNYPNPFNPTTNIKFDLPQAGNVKIEVYDMLGKEIRILADEFKEAGSYEIKFDASHLSSGTYFYKLTSGRFTDIKKMVLIK